MDLQIKITRKINTFTRTAIMINNKVEVRIATLVQVRIILGMKINILVIALIKTGNTKKSRIKGIITEKRNVKMHIYTWREHSKTREWLHYYKEIEQLQSIRECFSGAKIKCMEDYAQPTIKTNPDHIVIHVRTPPVFASLSTWKFYTVIKTSTLLIMGILLLHVI